MSKELNILSDSSLTSTIKRIATHQLKVGMFLVGVDESWWKSPLFRHNRLLRNQAEIDKLKRSDIKEVLIDSSRGVDVNDKEEECFDSDAVQEVLSKVTITRTEVTEELTEGENLSGEPSLSAHHAAQMVRNDTIQAVEAVFDGVKTGEAINHQKLKHMTDALLEQVFSQGDAMVESILIQNLRAFDKALYGHVVDVAVLSVMVGIQLNFDEESLQHVALGALLHDVGHVRIPRNILRRRHNLFDEDEMVFKRHVELGLAILDCCPTIPPAVQRVVAEHHERQDGSGYPKRLATDDISLLSDVVAFIDQFDALVSPWGGSTCLPTAMAVRKLYQDAKHGTLRAMPVEALIRCLGVYPIGSFVSLSTGERAVVLKPNASLPLKPTVKIIFDQQGKLLAIPLLEDLSVSCSSKGDRAIQTLLDPEKYKVDLRKYFS